MESPFPWWVNVAIFGAAAIWFVRTIQANIDLRQRELADLAGRLGLSFTGTDALGLAALPFDLLRVRGGTAVTNVLHGEFRGMTITAFDDRHLVALDDQRVILFSCAVTALDVEAPPMSVERQAASAFHFGATIGGAARISTESGEFDRAFHVRCDDRRFALAVLDPSLMGWLLRSNGNWNFELSGARLLCYSPQRRPGGVEKLLEELAGLRGRIQTRTVASNVASTATDPIARAAPVHRPMRVQSAALLTVLAVLGVAAALFGAVVAYLWLTGRLYVTAWP